MSGLSYETSYIAERVTYNNTTQGAQTEYTFRIGRGLHSSPAQQSPQADDGSI